MSNILKPEKFSPVNQADVEVNGQGSLHWSGVSSSTPSWECCSSAHPVGHNAMKEGHGENSSSFGYQQKPSFVIRSFLKPQIVTCHKSTVWGGKKNYFFIFNVLFSKACGSDSQVPRYTHSLWICTDKSHFNIAGVVSIYNWIDVMCGLEGNYLKFRARSQLKS